MRKKSVFARLLHTIYGAEDKYILHIRILMARVCMYKSMQKCCFQGLCCGRTWRLEGGIERLCRIIDAGTNVLEGWKNIITNQKSGSLRHTGKVVVKNSIETAHVFMIQTFWKSKGVKTANHLKSFCLPEIRPVCYFSWLNRNQLNQLVTKFVYATPYSVCRL